MDEKWAFVGRKQKHCDPEQSDDHRRGDCWDHVAFDPEHRLVLGVVCGKRSGTRILELMRAVKKRLPRRLPRLITSDGFKAYRTVLDLLWRDPPRPASGGRSGKRPSRPPARPPARVGLNYATVRKQRAKGRIISVQTEVVFGTERSIRAALKQSRVSTAVNTSFIERHNGTDRHRNARKGRRTYRFSKDWEIHCAVTMFTCYAYNFCWCVRTLAQGRKGRKRPRTPAMAAKLTDHVWTLHEWLAYPVPAPAS